MFQKTEGELAMMQLMALAAKLDADLTPEERAEKEIDRQRVYRYFKMNRRCISCKYGFSGNVPIRALPNEIVDGFTCTACGTFNCCKDKPLREVLK